MADDMELNCILEDYLSVNLINIQYLKYLAQGISQRVFLCMKTSTSFNSNKGLHLLCY